MKVSVIIPTCGRPEMLAACLARLAPGAQALGADGYEVIVSDDGAPEARVEEMLVERFAWVRWLAGPRRGPAANRNRGAGGATGDVLVFFDDDCLPEPEVLAVYARVFEEDAKVGAAEGRISADREPTRLDEEAPVNETGGCFWSCNIAVRAAVFRRLGGFDERFPHAAMEDVELRRRLKLAGERIVFLREAGVVHPLRRVGGWATVKRRAAAHGIYLRMETTHLTPYTWAVAGRRFFRSWVKGILPQLWRMRGRGLWLRTQSSMLPFLCVSEMRRAAKLPRLAVWTGKSNPSGAAGGGEP